MTKEECLQILKLLSALETQMLNGAQRVPDHLEEGIEIAMRNLEREILR